MPAPDCRQLELHSEQRQSANGCELQHHGNGTAGGTLSANLVNANTQYNLNGNRAFAITGGALWPNSNTFAGVGAGASTTPSSSSDNGSNNSFFGVAAGTANSTGFQNAFFGSSTGIANTTGSGNSFFGNQAGYMNTTGGLNSFFGIGPDYRRLPAISIRSLVIALVRATPPAAAT
jgi:hypothetical protein